MRRLWPLLLVLAFIARCAYAQRASATQAPATHITLGQSIVALYGPWKFHIGDNSQWADPNFDDSQWETVDLTPKAGAIDPTIGISGYVPGWTVKGHPGYWGYAWYRIRVRVTARPGGRLALAGPTDIDDAYQVFANGNLLGSFGKFPGGRRPPVVYSTQPRIFRLPQPDAGGSKSLGSAVQVLAFRVWMEQNTLQLGPDAGGFHTAPQLGDANIVEARYRLAWLNLIRAYASSLVLAVLFFLLAVVACSLTLFDRSDAVYLWLAAVFLLTAIAYAENPLVAWAQIESLAASSRFDSILVAPLTSFGWVMVWWVWFRLRSPDWMPRVIVGITLLYMVSDALGRDLFSTVIPYQISTPFHLASILIRLLFLPLLIFIVYRGVRAQGQEGWLVLPAVILYVISSFATDLNVLHLHTIWFPFGVQLAFGAVADLALAAAMFALLLRRLLLSVRRQREMALDVKQAAEVQHMLIPAALPQTPGLTIESEYRPAREVGGDFFQIIPDETNSSVLFVVGDVTGKGLQAGMLVALIVGTIRTTIETGFDPLDVLQSLNRRLCGRGHAHATCLALRIDANGEATLANAGHLPPYLNGRELPMEGAVPLGMIASAEFSLLQFQLQKDDRLLLMSDGVVEAQDEQGQLFGFERIQALLQKPITAAEVATAAQNFGQQDDISVLRIVRTTSFASKDSGESALTLV
jgi:Stage II sporulation protein E (SpoIIE)